MDEIFIERIVKRKVDIKGMLLRVLACCIERFVIMHNFILRKCLGCHYYIYSAYLTYLVWA